MGIYIWTVYLASTTSWIRIHKDASKALHGGVMTDKYSGVVEGPNIQGVVFSSNIWTMYPYNASPTSWYNPHSRLSRR